MNYYQARQVDPKADRPDAGKWRYTKMNDGAVWPVGLCATDCAAGHDTPAEACQHFVEGEIARGVTWNECSWTTCENHCDRPARRIGYVGGPHNHGYALCDDHATVDLVIALYRADHEGEFSSMASW